VSPATALARIEGGLPRLIAEAGERAAWRFLEFFAVNIRNKNTRAAYGQAAGAFLRWCEDRGITCSEDVQKVHVAGYIEQLQGVRSAPTVKQHLACIRMLFDWLVTGQVVPSNPAHAVRGPRHSVRKGSTTVMSSEDTRAFLKTIDTSHVVGLRDRALIAVMVYSFARVSAVVGLTVEDYLPLKTRSWLRLHEKGGKVNDRSHRQAFQPAYVARRCMVHGSAEGRGRRNRNSDREPFLPRHRYDRLYGEWRRYHRGAAHGRACQHQNYADVRPARRRSEL
jgi:integrase/recombinase XerD